MTESMLNKNLIDIQNFGNELFPRAFFCQAFSALFLYLSYNSYLVYKREMEHTTNSGSDSYPGEDQAQPPSTAELTIL